MKYAATTDVSSERSRGEIEKILQRYGASHFFYASSPDCANLGFTVRGRTVRFTLPMPDPKSPEFNLTPTGRTRKNDNASEAAYEQAVRQRWRALALCIKAKLEAVESEITTFEKEFLAHFIMPDNRSLADHILPQLENMSGKMPRLLLGN
jgi:hypothetical protein